MADVVMDVGKQVPEVAPELPGMDKAPGSKVEALEMVLAMDLAEEVMV
jgi:hypothetical protein